MPGPVDRVRGSPRVREEFVTKGVPDLTNAPDMVLTGEEDNVAAVDLGHLGVLCPRRAPEAAIPLGCSSIKDSSSEDVSLSRYGGSENGTGLSRVSRQWRRAAGLP